MSGCVYNTINPMYQQYALLFATLFIVLGLYIVVKALLSSIGIEVCKCEFYKKKDNLIYEYEETGLTKEEWDKLTDKEKKELMK